MRSVRPSKVLAGLNAALLHQGNDGERFLTVAYASLTRSSGMPVLVLCSAGHPPPLLRRASGEVIAACPPGMPLGMFDRPTLIDATVALGPGDAVVFYSDGVTEARAGGEEFGGERLRAVIAGGPTTGAADLARHVEAAVTAFRDGLPGDDTAVLVLSLPPDRPG